MRRLNKKLFLVFITIAFYGAAHVQVIENLHQVLPLVNSKSIVIFDLHQSLICSEQMLGREEAFNEAVQIEIENGFSKNEALERISSRYNLWQQFIDVKLIEENTPAVLNAIHQKQALTLACSTKNKVMSGIFNLQLKSVNLDLSNPFTQNNDFIGRSASLCHHILFLPFENPSEFLAHWLYQYQSYFEQVIYISTNQNELDQLHAQFLDHPLTFTGLYYQTKTESFDSQIALIQEEYLNSVISDQNAELILLSETMP